jgi:hypothetical protein
MLMSAPLLAFVTHQERNVGAKPDPYMAGTDRLIDLGQQRLLSRCLAECALELSSVGLSDAGALLLRRRKKIIDRTLAVPKPKEPKA